MDPLVEAAMALVTLLVDREIRGHLDAEELCNGPMAGSSPAVARQVPFRPNTQIRSRHSEVVCGNGAVAQPVLARH